jgi:hypothetical protein
MEEKHLPWIEKAGQEGVQILCLQEIFNTPYFCPAQTPEWCDTRRGRPGPDHRALIAAGQEVRMVIVVPDLRAREHRRLLQHRRGHRRRWASTSASIGSTTSRRPTASGRSITSSPETWATRLQDALREDRRLHLLRPPLPRGRADPRPERRRDRLQPVGHGRRACRSTCGSWSSRPTRSRTATSSARRTASAPRSPGHRPLLRQSRTSCDPRG